MYKGKLKTPIWHGIYPRCSILVKEEYPHHNRVIQFSSILHVLYVNILILFLKNPFIIFVILISFYLKPRWGFSPYVKLYAITCFTIQLGYGRSKVSIIFPANE